jgi:hypothetical protein
VWLTRSDVNLIQTVSVRDRLRIDSALVADTKRIQEWSEVGTGLGLSPGLRRDFARTDAGPCLYLFYKRGCQGKTLLRPQEWEQFSAIQPSAGRPYTVCTSTLSLPDTWIHRCCVVSADILMPVSSVLAMWPTMVLSETRGLLLDWVVRGGIQSLVRLKA